MRFDLQLPELSRFWVRHSPRIWPYSDDLWTHVGKASLGDLSPSSRVGRGAGPRHGGSHLSVALSAPPSEAPLSLDDLLYFPPVQVDSRPGRNRWVAAYVAVGTPVMVQLFPGEAPLDGALSLYDPLPTLVTGEVADLDKLPAGCTVVWPLVPGLSDDPGQWEECCQRMAAAGVQRVQAQTLHLSPSQRRRLAETAPEEAFNAIFHRQAPAERGFDQVAHRCGLEVFLNRPTQDVLPRVADNRRLAATMALAGELWLRLDRPMHRGDDLFRAARWIDTASQDVGALAREGNLGIVEAIRGLGRELLEQIVGQQEGSLVEELRQEYLEGDL